MKRTELLAPAGNLTKLKIAILYGADAVYIGGKKFSLRARANNFSLTDIKEACLFAKEHQAYVYVTMNMIAHNQDLNDLEDYLCYLQEVGVKAIITSSLYIIEISRQVAPKLEIHLSTQLSVVNSQALSFYQSLGVSRIVIGREATLEEIAAIQKKNNLDLEVFIHGGMCSSYSGRCMLSNYMVNRDANRGGCAHSCRWNYNLWNDNNKINKTNFFNMGSRDLMTIDVIEKLIALEIASLKIEGRMKSEYYIATVVKTYRQIIDEFYQNGCVSLDKYYTEIQKAENRICSTGFLKGQITVKEQLYDRDDHPTKEFVGVVLKYNIDTKECLIEQRNYFAIGDTLEFFGPQLNNTLYYVNKIYDFEYNEIKVARHPRQLIILYVDFIVQQFDMIRLVKRSV